MLLERKATAKVEGDELADLRRFSENILIDFTDGFKNLNADKVLEFKHDVLQWKHDGYNRPLPEYKNRNIKLRFMLPDERVETLNMLYAQFKSTDMNQTLRKMVEYMNKSDLFYEASYL